MAENFCVMQAVESEAIGARNMVDQSIELIDYDPAWLARFLEQKTRLTMILNPWLAGEIEHIGSTSVPGLRSKPIVDMLAPVQSVAASRAATPILEEDGWLFWTDDPIRTIVSGFSGRTLRRALTTYR
jgi:GrpB-like predicted nucleotidyltransferase (UPF0157 family)